LNADNVRYAAVLAVLVALGARNGIINIPALGAPKPPPVVASDYTGRMADLHRESRRMDPAHRAAMSQAFGLAADSYQRDSSTVETTRQWQRFAEATLQFAYRDMGRVDVRYPEIARLLTAELSRVAGGEEVRIQDKAPFVDVLREISRAVR
jgi:hypothetical protein